MIVCIGFIAVFCFYQPILQFLTAIPMENGVSGLAQYKMERLHIVNRTAIDQSVGLPADSRFVSGGRFDEQKGGHPHYLLGPGEALTYDRIIHSPLLIMGPIEGLVLVLKACFWLSIALTAPFWGWVWLQFILPGTRAHEKAA